MAKVHWILLLKENKQLVLTSSENMKYLYVSLSFSPMPTCLLASTALPAIQKDMANLLVFHPNEQWRIVKAEIPHEPLKKSSSDLWSRSVPHRIYVTTSPFRGHLPHSITHQPITAVLQSNKKATKRRHVGSHQQSAKLQLGEQSLTTTRENNNHHSSRWETWF